MTTDSQESLPIIGGRSKGTTRGPVYQGVAKQIRELIKADVADRGLQAGTISQARSLAHSIDVASGHFSPSSREYGASLATMHRQLDELLAVLRGDARPASAFDQLLDDDLE